MKPIDNLTAAFECLWEAKVYLLRAEKDADEATRASARAILQEVGATRDRLEQALIELEGRLAGAPRPPAG